MVSTLPPHAERAMRWSAATFGALFLAGMAESWQPLVITFSGSVMIAICLMIYIVYLWIESDFKGKPNLETPMEMMEMT